MSVAFDSETNTVVIEPVEGVQYKVGNTHVDESFVITEPTKVHAVPLEGYRFTEGAQDEWEFEPVKKR